MTSSRISSGNAAKNDGSMPSGTCITLTDADVKLLATLATIEDVGSLDTEGVSLAFGVCDTPVRMLESPVRMLESPVRMPAFR